ncbi:hypothetical protein ABPG75_009554 [Micractinium tetrahymenae]
MLSRGPACPPTSAPALPHIPQPQAVAAPPQQPDAWSRRAGLRAAALCLAGLAASGGAAPPPAAASIPLGPPSSQQAADVQRAWAASQLGARYQFAGPAQQPAAEEPTAVRIQQLQALMRAGNEAAAAGRYEEALQQYDAVVQQFPNFATTEYARLARGLMLYQLGRTSDAILQLEDLEVTLRGYAEWEIAMEFNQRFADAQWVAETKHWPPRLMAALDRFLRLA